MGLFKDTLKLYYFRDRDLVSLNIKSSPHHVLSLYIPAPTFEKLIGPAPGKEGLRIDPYFIMRKKEHLRLTIDNHTVVHNVRVEIDKWDAMVEQYRAGREANTTDNVVTCVVN